MLSPSFLVVISVAILGCDPQTMNCVLSCHAHLSPPHLFSSPYSQLSKKSQLFSMLATVFTKWQPRMKNEHVCMWWKAVVLLVFGLIFNTSRCGGSSKPPIPPLFSGGPWERCTFPGRHSYVPTERRAWTWAGSHQCNNMWARHSAWLRGALV